MHFAICIFHFALHCPGSAGTQLPGCIRDEATGNPISDPVNIKIAILAADATTIIREELHSAVDPDNNGLFSLVIGQGSLVSGVSFSDIDWSVTPKYILTKIWYDGGYKDLGPAQLWSVPYSMISDNIIQPLDKLTVKGTHTNLVDPLFEVKNQAGNTLFGVYNEGVEIFVGDGAKGPKGGFAIGTVGTKADYFMNLTPENYFIGEGAGSKNVGGLYNTFLGYNSGVENTEGYSNIFIGKEAGLNNIDGALNTFIGTASGHDNKFGWYNTFLGTNAGYSNTGSSTPGDGYFNVFVGPMSGYSNTTGRDNIYIGYNTGFWNQTGGSNTFIGTFSGKKTTVGGNTFIGLSSGENNSTGTNNIFIGVQTGEKSTTGSSNTFVGHLAGWNNDDGSNNTYIGEYTGQAKVDAIQNVFLGAYAGAYGSTGSRNTYLGYGAGGGNTESGNVFIGNEAGSSETTGNKLYIENSSFGPDLALIYGDFENDLLKLNAKVTINDVLHLTPRSEPPAGATMGDIYFDLETKDLWYYDGTLWRKIAFKE